MLLVLFVCLLIYKLKKLILQNIFVNVYVKINKRKQILIADHIFLYFWEVIRKKFLFLYKNSKRVKTFYNQKSQQYAGFIKWLTTKDF